MNVKPKVVVIGAGIIGVTSAINLQKKGHQVILLDKGGVAAGASTGNCGLMAVSEIVPISKPGVLSQVPNWLMDPEGPVTVRAKHALTMMPWFMRFLKSGSENNVNNIAQGLTQLSNKAAAAYAPLLKESDIEDLLKPHEVIYLFDDRNEIIEDQFSWDLRHNCGFKMEFLEGDILREMEPEISPNIDSGMLMKGWDYFSDPQRLTQSLANTFSQNGGEIRLSKVTDLIKKDGKIIAALLDNYEKLEADHFVIACGAWSRILADQVGDYIPVEAMAGYNTTILRPNVSLKHPLLHHNGGFVITPMEMGLRVGGTLELGGLNSEPNYNRVRAITRKAQNILPNLEIIEKTEWVGYRPMMPDTLPVIDKSPRYSNLIYACGHGQLGITYGAITGELVADLITQGSSEKVNMSPYSATRF
ncbi:NAD(P)/FAD-dependent oxidoreductase [Marinomonas sp. PE14-40]|uniref:NAD(P)/FAD-dependent oxidoreductase n=1 Tax=Marinomonas sp. PE14-40 TaxID=3060621 RepID=UPI003F66F096